MKRKKMPWFYFIVIKATTCFQTIRKYQHVQKYIEYINTESFFIFITPLTSLSLSDSWARLCLRVLSCCWSSLVFFSWLCRSEFAELSFFSTLAFPSTSWSSLLFCSCMVWLCAVTFNLACQTEVFSETTVIQWPYEGDEVGLLFSNTLILKNIYG